MRRRSSSRWSRKLILDRRYFVVLVGHVAIGRRAESRSDVSDSHRRAGERRARPGCDRARRSRGAGSAPRASAAHRRRTRQRLARGVVTAGGDGGVVRAVWRSSFRISSSSVLRRLVRRALELREALAERPPELRQLARPEDDERDDEDDDEFRKTEWTHGALLTHVERAYPRSITCLPCHRVRPDGFPTRCRNPLCLR